MSARPGFAAEQTAQNDAMRMLSPRFKDLARRWRAKLKASYSDLEDIEGAIWLAWTENQPNGGDLFKPGNEGRLFFSVKNSMPRFQISAACGCASEDEEDYHGEDYSGSEAPGWGGGLEDLIEAAEFEQVAGAWLDALADLNKLTAKIAGEVFGVCTRQGGNICKDLLAPARWQIIEAAAKAQGISKEKLAEM